MRTDRRCRNCQHVWAPKLRGFKELRGLTRAGTEKRLEEFSPDAKGVKYKEVVGNTACGITGKQKHPDDYCDHYSRYD